MSLPPEPLVSVVTPSLDQGRFVEETIRSVLAQDYPRIEHIVVDGGSTDGTLEILARYPHLRWLSERDRGQADAINKGFRIANGEIFAWLNADDYYLPGAVSAGVAGLVESGSGLVYGGWRLVDESGAVLRELPARPFDYHELLNAMNAIAQPSSFFTREAFAAVGGLDTSYHYALDYDLWLRIGARFELRRLDGVLSAFRVHPDSKSEARPERFWPEVRRSSRAHGGRFFSPIFWHTLPHRRPLLFRAVVAYRLLRAGDLRTLVGALRRRLARPFRREAA